MRAGALRWVLMAWIGPVPATVAADSGGAGPADRDAAGRSCWHDGIHLCCHPHPARRDTLPRRMAVAGVLRRPRPPPRAGRSPAPGRQSLAGPRWLPGVRQTPGQRIGARGGDSSPVRQRRRLASPGPGTTIAAARPPELSPP